ncbi:LTA synthase family protein [Pontibacter akesuensis]|nr:O-antigen ligase family protein [Pontibacter akesuensis]
MWAFAGYLFLKKKELSLLYVPVLVFANTVIEVHLIPSLGYYALVSFLLLTAINKNAFFLRHNVFSIFLALYFVVLMFQSSDLIAIRPFLLAVMWFFLSLPLIVSIYQKHFRKEIFDNLANAAGIILVLFVSNVVVSSYFRYSAHSMYGISSGILYGNLSATDFNIIPIAAFIVLLKLLQKRNLVYLAAYTLSLAFIMLSMRRSVIAICIMGIFVLVLILIAQKNLKMVVAFSGIALVLGFLVIANTNFLSVFEERYALRKLDERELEEEKRFMEYELLYRDMFVYNDYDPLTGFELFNSSGNYSRGALEERSLHGDLNNIAHSSGLIGVALYLLMVLTPFIKANRAVGNSTDRLIVLFCAIAFLAYTITGRYTEVGCMILLFLLLNLPLCKEEDSTEVELNEEKEHHLIHA